MTSIPYSEKELADKAKIETDIGLSGTFLEKIRNAFLDPELNDTGVIVVVTPPVRCSDGKRRNFMDYIDYLFPDPPIETLAEQLIREDDRFGILLKVSDTIISVRYRKKSLL